MQRLTQAVVVDDRAWLREIALNLAPDWLGEVAIGMPARDDMPMQMGRHVAEAGKIDLVGRKQRPYDLFHPEHHGHESLPFRGGQSTSVICKSTSFSG